MKHPDRPPAATRRARAEKPEADASEARRADSIVAQALAAGAIALVVYGVTCARTVTFDDSGELILASATLGIAHPPGYPTYLLLGHLFSKLPFGAPALRVALLSAVGAAAVAAASAAILGELARAGGPDEPGRRSADASRSARGRKSGKRAGGDDEAASQRSGSTFGLRHPWLRWWPAAGGLGIAFGATLWSYATTAEVYTTSLALLAAVLWAALVWRRRFLAERAESALAVLGAGALVLGLGMGAHHPSILLALPAIGYFVARTAGLRYLVGRAGLVAAVAFGLGLSVYAYLPWAASREPLLAWGAPMTWLRFRQHVTAQIYQGYLLAQGFDGVWAKLARIADLLWRDGTPLAAAFVVVALPSLWRRHRLVLQSLGSLVAANLGFGLLYHNTENWDAYLLPSLLAGGLVAAWGAGRLAAGAQGASRGSLVVAALVLAAWPAAAFAANLGRSDRSADRLAAQFVGDVLAGVEPGAVVVTRNWHFSSPFLYLRHLEGVRPDVTVLDVNLSRLSWCVRSYLEHALEYGPGNRRTLQSLARVRAMR